MITYNQLSVWDNVRIHHPPVNPHLRWSLFQPKLNLTLNIHLKSITNPGTYLHDFFNILIEEILQTNLRRWILKLPTVLSTIRQLPHTYMQDFFMSFKNFTVCIGSSKMELVAKNITLYVLQCHILNLFLKYAF